MVLRKAGTLATSTESLRPTGPFTPLKLQNLSPNVPELLHKIRRIPNLKGSKIGKESAGHEFILHFQCVPHFSAHIRTYRAHKEEDGEEEEGEKKRHSAKFQRKMDRY